MILFYRKQFFTSSSFKARIVTFLSLFFCAALSSQTTIYTQPFSGTLVASGWTSTNLTVPWGNGSLFGQNAWRVNDTESGMSANTCGTAGALDQSLHVNHPIAGGAAYLADIFANKRISSPSINTTGYTNIVTEFDFIGNGEGTSDKAYFQYSLNAGVSWISVTGAPTASSPALPLGSDMNNLKSQICGTGQGRWTHITLNMPVTCEGITGFRVGIVWQNDNNTSGSDPSFAIDDVLITGITTLPIELLSFEALSRTSDVQLEWVTASEQNNDHFTIERSSDGLNFETISEVQGAGNSSQNISYATIDPFPLPGLSYYRLKQTDFDGKYEYSDIKTVSRETEDFYINSVFGSINSEQLFIEFNCSGDCNIALQILDVAGRVVVDKKENVAGKSSKISIPIASLSQGIYFIKASRKDNLIVRKIKL